MDEDPKPETEGANFDFKLGQKDFDEHELEHKESNCQAGSLVDQCSDQEEDSQTPTEMNDEWQSKSKHIFILSEAGKPIYSL